MNEKKFGYVCILILLVISSSSLLLTSVFSDKYRLSIELEYKDEVPYGITLIGADKVWNKTRGSPEIVVAVLDTGLDDSHSDLEYVLWNNSDEKQDNSIDDDNNGYIDDCHGWDFIQNNTDHFNFSLYEGSQYETSLTNHGTHVTGTIAARLNNYGVVGVAPNVTIMTLRVVNKDNENPDIIVAEAIRYAADNGAHIISMSIGIYFPEEITNSTSYQLVENALEYAFGKGILIVASAGNDHSIVSQPANNDYVIAVGAIDGAKNIPSYSNKGPELEFVAPGVGVYSTIPYNIYGYSSGTSMAAPHVSGALALMISYDPTLNNTEVRSILQQTAVDLGDPGRDEAYGFGMINVTHAFEIIEEMNHTNSTSSEVTSFSSTITSLTTSETTTISSNTMDTSPTTSESITTSIITSETTGISLSTSETTPMVVSLFSMLVILAFSKKIVNQRRRKENL